jgi:hypothetical protein
MDRYTAATTDIAGELVEDDLQRVQWTRSNDAQICKHIGSHKSPWREWLRGGV